MYVLEYIISALAPHRCLGCLVEGPLLCLACAQNLLPAPSRCYKCGKSGLDSLCGDCCPQSSLDALVTTVRYEGRAKNLVHSLKFKRASAAVLPMAYLLNRQLNADYTLVSFVPTATSRVRRRGYDQAALLAREVARLAGLPCRSLLNRQGQHRQVGRNRAVRREQLVAAFQPANHQVLATEHILLIDDVLTTGATLEAAAQTLRLAGATRITAAVFAVA